MPAPLSTLFSRSNAAGAMNPDVEEMNEPHQVQPDQHRNSHGQPEELVPQGNASSHHQYRQNGDRKHPRAALVDFIGKTTAVNNDGRRSHGSGVQAVQQGKHGSDGQFHPWIEEPPNEGHRGRRIEKPP